MFPLPWVAKGRKVQNPSLLDQGGPGNEWALYPHIFTQPKRWIGLFGGSPDPFQEPPHSFGWSLVFFGLLQPLQCIQPITLDEFLEELAEGLLMAKAL